MAATPEGASTTILFPELSLSRRRNVVFPVPALPVRKRLLPVSSTMRRASDSSRFMLIACSGSATLVGSTKQSVSYFICCLLEICLYGYGLRHIYP